MGFISSFTHPQNPYWQGPQRYHQIIFLIKTASLVVFMILIIAHDAAFKYTFNDREHDVRYVHFTKDWFFRTGFAVIPDTILTLFTIGAIPQSASSPNFFHPVFALSVSLVMVGVYAAIGFLHTIIIQGDESNTYNKEHWDSVDYAEAGFQVFLGLCYVGMAALSCIAVHQWRRAKGGARVDRLMHVEFEAFKNGRQNE